MPRILHPVSTGLLVIVVIAVLGRCSYSATRPDLLLNPISRQIYLADLRPDPRPGKGWFTEPVDLIPQNFTVGEPLEAAQRRLTDAGYAPSGGKSFVPITVWYFLEGTSFLLDCEDYLVELHASPEGRLLTATATKRHNRCVL